MSSYNEFDLVRQAMKLGTFDYLFKPAMLPPDIIEVVKKALQKQREKSSSRITESDRKRLSRDREQFFRDLISAAGIGRTWFEERAAAFGLPEPVGKNAVVVFRLIRYRKSMAEIFENDVSLLRASVCNVMSEALDSVKDCQFLCNKFDEYVWIVWEAREDGRQEFYERLEALIRTAADFLSRYYGLEFSIGISRSSASLFDCCQGYTEAADNGRES